MTRDEILAMEAGSEMDELIERYVLKNFSAYEFPPGIVNNPPKPYSTDFASAWMVVEKHPHYFSLARSNDTDGRRSPFGDTTWRCRFYAPEKFQAEAATAPLAICRAALLAVTEPA